MNNAMLYQTRRFAGVVEPGRTGWYGQVMLNGTASPEEVAALVAGQTRLTTSDVMYLHTKTGEAVRSIIMGGRAVSLDWVAFTIALTGSFERSDTLFDASRNALLVRAHARPFLRDCLAGIVPRNATGGLRASMQSVIDGALREEGVITVGEVYVAGRNILVGAAPDEGVWLVAKDGEIAATPVIAANTPSSMDLVFAELPSDGEYTLIVKARSGASADLAPAVARRSVTVRAAS